MATIQYKHRFIISRIYSYMVEHISSVTGANYCPDYYPSNIYAKQKHLGCKKQGQSEAAVIGIYM